jgi:hypothetical protein
LEECGKEFRTPHIKSSFCCELHGKRHGARIDAGTVGLFTGDIECALPECRKPVPRRGIMIRYCSSSCTDKHQKRLDTREALFYRRLLGVVDHVCVACPERLVLDEHHLEFTGTKSNKTSKAVWLCPTHHMAIHRSHARFDGDKFVWIHEEIREGLLRKHPALVESLGGGQSWGSK